MNKAATKPAPSFFTDEDRRRRKREAIIIACILSVVALLTYVEYRIVGIGGDISPSSTVLMFILININLLLLILMIFLVFRNIVKLLYDRRRKTMGAKLRTRLVLAFVMLTLLPTTILFFFSINFITMSIKLWLDVNIEQALESSRSVGQQVYAQTEKNNLFFLEKISSYIVSRELISEEKEKREHLSDYIKTTQQTFHIQGVEVYGSNLQRMAFSFSSDLEASAIQPVSADQLQKEPGEDQVRVAFQTIPSGELVKTIATIPFGEERLKAKGFVVVSDVISVDLTDALSNIRSGVETYSQMKLLKPQIQYIYYLALSIVTLLVLFCAVWYGFYIAKTLSVPIKELAEGTLRVASGDLDVTIDLVADDEIGSLVNSFNKMTQDLREGRRQLENSARILQNQNMEIEERRQFMEIVLKHVSAGVVSLDARGKVTTMSKSAEQMLDLDVEKILNTSYRYLLSEEYLNLAEDIREKLVRSATGSIETTIRISIAQRPRSFQLHVKALKDDRDNPLGYVLVFDDLTELEKAQRLAAWREVARRIAHEVKNPLTPIALSAQRLNRKYSDQINEPVFSECVQTIIDHVSLIRNLVNEFSAFAKFPSAKPEPCRVETIIEETVALYREGHPEVHFDLNFSNNLPEVNLDRQQMKQAMINLVDNAVGAMKASGDISLSVTHDPILKRVRIEVADTGPGISDEEKIRLFEPYFSTKQTGMGLGLTIVNSIVADHYGMIRVLDNHPRGARFVIELPVQVEASGMGAVGKNDG
jgi:two-component system nitrogen regulation sensor histidine kinase NtrY